MSLLPQAFALAFSVALSTAHAADFSISGIALGMTADEVMAKAGKLYHDPELKFNKWEIEGGPSWAANGTLFYVDRSIPDKTERDEIEFAFTGIGSGNTLFAVNREYLFHVDRKPTTGSIYEVLEKKFGKPSKFSTDDRKNIWASWSFMDREAPALDKAPYGNCEKMPVSLDKHSALETSKICGLTIFFSAQAGSNGLANGYRLTMTDYLNAAAAFHADEKRKAELVEEATKAATEKAAAPPDL